MNWILRLNVYLYVSMLFICGAFGESTIENLLSEVDVSWRHRPSEDRVPAFMHLLYEDLKEEMLRIHRTSWEDMYAQSPVIRSFRATPRDNSGRRFKFEISPSHNLNNVSDAYLIVNAANINITAKFRGISLERNRASFSNNYYAFNVMEALSTTQHENKANIHFHFVHTRHVPARDVFLVVYQHIAAAALDHSRHKRNTFQNSSMHFFQRFTQTSMEDVDERDCRRLEWVVDFTTIRWFWIIAPTSVSAGICSGSCSLLSTNRNTTNYTFMKTMFHIQNDDATIPHASCVPLLLAPITIIYYDRGYNVITRVVPELIVAGCGCR
ncbi:bone morphogenetic protein 4-like [Haliotis rubra]|uniref:bone morphogenetic protein 4-like n=1 Tax=Haliotis rubra TaxID=36100 RepID=UPI001EE55E6A|nr:bone morphogenetic protein 4-like [Haliotis rubra]